MSSPRHDWGALSLKNLTSPLALFALLFIVYQINLRQVSPDTVASRVVPVSLLTSGDLTLDEFPLSAPGEPLPRYLVQRGSHVYDSYPIAAPLLAVPVYALPVWLGLPADPIVLGDIVSKLAASAMAAGSASFLWLALVSFGHSTRVAWFVCLAYGLGTSVWSTASQGLWAHSPTVLAFAAAIWLQGRGHRAAGLAAMAVGAVSRPVMLLTLPFWWWLTMEKRGLDRPPESIASWLWRAVRVSTPAAAIVLANFAYNFWLVGSVLGTAEARNAIWTRAYGATSMWDGNFVEGAIGLLVAPSRGLLVYSPIVILAAIGLWRVWTIPPSRYRQIALASALATAIGYVAYANYLVWWGGHSYGPRYLTDITPFLGLLMALGLETPEGIARRAERPRRVGWLWTVLIAYSIAVQAIGAFCWPSVRDGRVDMAYYENLWNWRQPQILSCLESGPRFDPVGRRLLARFGLDVQAAPARTPD